MKIFALLQGKILLSVAAGTLLVGGATAAFASTPAGQNVMQALTHSHPAVSATHDTDHSDKDGPETPDANKAACPGSPDAQKLATSFHLSTDAKGAAVVAICALHDGTFKGTAVTADRHFGYGEIRDLLAAAQTLAAHDKTNTSGQLTDANVSSYLAAALQSCGSHDLEKCTPDQEKHDGNGPSGTPTPDNHKPTTTPTPKH